MKKTIRGYVNLKKRCFCYRFKQGIRQFKKDGNLIRNIRNGQFPPISMEITPIEKCSMIIFSGIRRFSLYRLANIKSADCYVLWWLTIILLLFFCQSYLHSYIIITLLIYRIIDILFYNLCIIFIDRYKVNWKLKSLNRSFLLLSLNYIEIVLSFSIIYLVYDLIGFSNYQEIIPNKIDALYFSIITFTTLGYGDIIPIGNLGRIVVILQLITFFGFVIIIMGTFLQGIENKK